jgi:uncharacterized protein (TIGR03437 family)
MNRKQGWAVSASLAACAAMAEAQAPTGSILHVEFVNSTVYFRGYCALADQGKTSTKLSRPATPAFPTGVGLADIVSVNGQAIKGTALEMFNGTLFTAAMTPGRAIGGASWQLTFLNLDGSLIGTLEISGQGTSADLRPPGAPIEFPGGSVYSVTAGTGPFLGVRGYFAPVQDTASPERQTTDCEDPAYRRINADAGGNKRHPVLFLIPVVGPQIAVTGGAPAVFHSDLTPVTASKPAAAGEVLISMATGLGSTRPGIDPGQPFPAYPANPVQPVNSPVGVIVNQQSADVINAIGWPGLVDTYRVDFRMPSGTTAGKASIQLSSAWISGPPVSIPVQ